MEKNKRGSCLFRLLAVLLAFFVLLLLFFLYERMKASEAFSGPRLGIVRVEGVIENSGPIVEWIEELRGNASVKGVLLRIDSGGGAVVPSQEIFLAVKRLAEAKPVVASMGGAAASGGYYAAAGAPYIVANTATLTGSIGVKMQLADVSGLLSRLGVGAPVMTSGAMKDAGSPYHALTEEEKAYFNGLMSELHAIFVRDMAEARRLPEEYVRQLADGRVYTGTQALELKLVDALGDQDFAMRELMARCGLAEMPGEIWDGPETALPWWEELFGSVLKSALNLHIEQGLGRARNELPFRFYY